MDIEQVLALLPSARGAALSDLIRQSIQSPSIHHYSPLLDAISSLENSESKHLFNVVKLFSYGNWSDYTESKEQIEYELNETETAKLKLLTLVALAASYHELDYDSTQTACGLESHSQLEDMFINASASGLLTGKMDQERKRLFIDSSVGRDVRPSELSELSVASSNWANKTRQILIETINAQRQELAQADYEKQREKQLTDEIRSVKEAIKLEQENQQRRPSSSLRHDDHNEKKFVRKEAIDMTGENEMKPKKYKLRGRKN